MKFVKSFNEFGLNENNNYGLSPEQIQTILDSYLEAAIWTDEERLIEEGATEDQLNIHNFSEEAKTKAIEDIKKFAELAGDVAIEEAISEIGLINIGHNIWLSRNGHGAGFFDDDYTSTEVLQQAARDLKEISVYLADNGQLDFE